MTATRPVPPVIFKPPAEPRCPWAPDELCACPVLGADNCPMIGCGGHVSRRPA